MNVITREFTGIIEQANTYGIPVIKKRAILREYLQMIILDAIYRERESKHLIFIGGTSLRIVRNLNRFSEDLDFDIPQNMMRFVDSYIEHIISMLNRYEIKVEKYHNKTSRRNYYELRFPKLLFETGISNISEEKLAIKMDFESYWKHNKQEVVLVQKFGYSQSIITASQSVVLTQKIVAFSSRKVLTVRDIYDVVWLISRGAILDWDFMKVNDLTYSIVDNALKRYKENQKQIPMLKRKLAPFLFDEKDVKSLDYFEESLKRLELQNE